MFPSMQSDHDIPLSLYMFILIYIIPHVPFTMIYFRSFHAIIPDLKPVFHHSNHCSQKQGPTNG